MPVIRVDTTPMPTLTSEKRAAVLAKLKNEFSQGTKDGPIIFEIPLGTDCFDVLVIWENLDWIKLRPEERSDLIRDAYDHDKREQIAQASGVTYDEAIQQGLLPYTIVSSFEQNAKFASQACYKDKSAIEELMGQIRNAKLANGGIVWPNGKLELRFPTRAMVDAVYAKLSTDPEYKYFYWSVVVEVAASN